MKALFGTPFKKSLISVLSLRPGLVNLVSSRGFRRLVIVGLICLLSCLAFFSMKKALHLSVIKLPTIEEQRIGLMILDGRDRLVCTVHKDGDREPVPLDQVSDNVRKAVIAIEDRSFYQHHGVDPLGILRAVLSNMIKGELHQGGSTITQQLMKTIYFDYKDRTAKRKLMEIFMALDVESCYPKDMILETYLNQVYFGRGAYGIERAAITYFNKSAGMLSIPEAAYLAGLIKAPSDLGNPANAARAKKRQEQVLKAMLECGYISSLDEERYRAQKLAFESGPHRLKFPHYVNHVVGILEDRLGKDKLWTQTLKIYTCLDPAAQAEGEKVLSRGVRKAPIGLDQGALVSISPDNGSVVAMVGSVGPYEKSQWNRALNPHTAGSAFKPLVYLTALMEGKLDQNSFVNDSPIVVPAGPRSYTPQNFDGAFMGLMTVRQALALSRNVPAVKVASDTGVRRVIDVARKTGISSEMDVVPSLALGTCAVSPLEMCNVYATMVRGGDFIEPRFVRKIEAEDGALMASFETRREKRLPTEPCLQIVDALKDVITEGTGKRAGLAGVEVAGKTGTADGNKDVWFVGATPDLVTAVWAGNDENDPIKARGVTGGTVAAGIWAQYMNSYYHSHKKPREGFASPKDPLSRELPFYVSIPFAVKSAVNSVVNDAVTGISKAVESATRPVTESLMSVSKESDKFFKSVGDTINQAF